MKEERLVNDNRGGNKAILTFDEGVEIKGKIIPAARCKVEGISEDVFFIPRKEISISEKSESYLVVLPSLYYKGKSIYSVKIIIPEIIGNIKVFNDVFIPDDLFNSPNNDISVLIMNPKEGFETLLLRIVTNNGNTEVVRRFLTKNILWEHAEVRIKENGIIEIILESLEDFNYLRSDFIKHLSNQIYPEA